MSVGSLRKPSADRSILHPQLRKGKAPFLSCCMRISNLGPLERELQTEQWRQRSVARIASKLATTNAGGRTHHACLRHIHVSIYNVHLDVHKEGNISSSRSSSPPLSLRLCSNECCRGHAVWQVDNCPRHPPRTPQGQAWKHVFVIKADTKRIRPSSLIPNHSLETLSARYELSPPNARESPSTKATPSEPLANAPRLGHRPRSLRRLGQPRRQEGSDSFSRMLTQDFVSNHHPRDVLFFWMRQEDTSFARTTTRSSRPRAPSPCSCVSSARVRTSPILKRMSPFGTCLDRVSSERSGGD